MQIKNTLGQPVDVTPDEVARAATLLGWSKQTTAEHLQSKAANMEHIHKHAAEYMKHALDCIEHMTGCRPSTEQEMKEFMYKHLPIGTQEDTNLMYECIEAIIGWYGCMMLAHVQQD